MLIINFIILFLMLPMIAMARVGFGYSFDIFVLGNSTGFILRITPVLG